MTSMTQEQQQQTPQKQVPQEPQDENFWTPIKKPDFKNTIRRRKPRGKGAVKKHVLSSPIKLDFSTITSA